MLFAIKRLNSHRINELFWVPDHIDVCSVLRKGIADGMVRKSLIAILLIVGAIGVLSVGFGQHYLSKENLSVFGSGGLATRQAPRPVTRNTRPTPIAVQGAVLASSTEKPSPQATVVDDRSMESANPVPNNGGSSGGSAQLVPDPPKEHHSGHQQHAKDRMVIALISHGWKASGYESNETVKGSKMSMPLTLKGILRTVKQCSSFRIYFVTGDEDERRIRGLLKPIQHAPVNFTYQFVGLNETQLEEWMNFINHKASHRTGPAGNVKYFYPLIFPKEERMMMLDTDVLIGRDLCQLWNEFNKFKPEQLFAFAPQWPTVDPHKDNQFNAGVALLHLERMRQANWLQLSKDSIENWAEKNMKPKCCAHGDQSAFHMVRFYRPSTLGYLPRWWNINKCHNYQNIHRKPKGSFVGLVHLGCCKMCTRSKIGRFASLFDSINNISLEHDFVHTDGFVKEVNDSLV